MMSSSTQVLSSILRLVGKEVSVKQLAKKTPAELAEAETWAVTLNAKNQEEELGRKVPTVPPMPGWLFKH